MTDELCSASGKRRYHSYRHALYDMTAMLRSRESLQRKCKLEVYWCRQCQSWHVGTKLKYAI